ncbi:hypothetical protein EGW08_009487 [Elysia chlorotica]|uniref:Ciliary neurotrophic factor n=1 Tax=Elysia chlorotica TaxID=188477 RepID=A0A3S1A4U6_ELYCH|nr:hypothetical protein EGW08_009487 [Elysia chlorotica]
MYSSVIAAMILLCSMPLSDARAINNPCQVQDIPSLTKQLTDTIEQMALANTSANDLMSALRGPGFLTEDDQNQLNATENLQDLPLLVEADNLTVTNMVDFLHESCRIVSTHIAYVQVALSEQVANDGRLLETELSHLESKLFELLCNVHALAHTKNASCATIESTVDASVVPSAIRNIQDATLRYMRNYILGKDTKIFLGNLKANFMTLLNKNEK